MARARTRTGGRARTGDRSTAAHARGAGSGDNGYFWLSARPLHVLAFLAPVLVVYEIGSIVYVRAGEGAVATLKAQRILSGFFEAFGVVGLHLPAAAMVAVLVVWHVLNRDRWRLRPMVLGSMAVETVLWTFPLLLLGVMLHYSGVTPPSFVAPQPPGSSLTELPWRVRLTIALGAGLYEEFLFRMIGIAALHLVLSDLARMREVPARGLAIGLTALAFALLHDAVRSPVGFLGLDWSAMVYYLVPGVYFGILYAVRGFGIVAGVHAAYDVLVLVLLRPPQ